MLRKKIYSVVFFPMLLLIFFSSVYAQQNSAKKFPVYYQFRWNANRMDDEEFFRENVKNILWHIDLMQKYDIKADYYFTGSLTEQFSSQAPEDEYVD